MAKGLKNKDVYYLILQRCLLYIFVICISTLQASSVAPQTTIHFDTNAKALCDWFWENAGRGSVFHT